MAAKINGWQTVVGNDETEAQFVIVGEQSTEILHIRKKGQDRWFWWDFQGTEKAARKRLSDWKKGQVNIGHAPVRADISDSLLRDARMATSTGVAADAERYWTFNDENDLPRKVILAKDALDRFVVQVAGPLHWETGAWIFHERDVAETEIARRLKGLRELGIVYQEHHPSRADAPPWCIEPLVLTTPSGLEFHPIIF